MTRFDLVVTRRMRETQSITVAGACGPAESRLIDESVDEVRCGWCGGSDEIVEIGPVARRTGRHG